MGPKWILAAVCAIILAAGVGWWLFRPEPASIPATAPKATAGRIPTRAEMDAMETQAGDACRCARRLPAASAARTPCWAEFERSIGRFPHSEASSMCMPLSATVICFGDDMENCIVKDHDGGACTSEEARILESIWEREGGPSLSQASQRRASQLMDEAVQRFIRGEHVAAPRTSEGCSG